MDNESAESIDQRVAARIRERRIDMGITLQSLARQIGVAFQQAHKYERGLSRISAGRLYHVALALKTPIAFFFTAGESPTRSDSESAASPRANAAAGRKPGTGVGNAA